MPLPMYADSYQNVLTAALQQHIRQLISIMTFIRRAVISHDCAVTMNGHAVVQHDKVLHVLNDSWRVDSFYGSS